jgi:hypothetical protein
MEHGKHWWIMEKHGWSMVNIGGAWRMSMEHEGTLMEHLGMRTYCHKSSSFSCS